MTEEKARTSETSQRARFIIVTILLVVSLVLIAGVLLVVAH
jgi:hypothetical protein